MEDNKSLLNSTKNILNYCKNPYVGLPEEVFLMVSALIPIVNVDLFVFNKNNEILLSWREDDFYEKAWSIPGGCLRFGETMVERAHKTALKEFGIDVSIINGPVTVKDVIRGPLERLNFPNIRGHNIAIPFICRLKDEDSINVIGSEPKYAGDLKWFSKIPKNILKVHDVYQDLFKFYGL